LAGREARGWLRPINTGSGDIKCVRRVPRAIRM